MKKFIPTLGLLVILAGLLAYAYFYEQGPAGDEDSEENVVVYEIDADSIQRIEIDEGYEMTALERQDGEWRLTAPYDAATEKFVTENLVDAASSLEAETRIDDVDSLAGFGLTEPERKITVFLEDGEEMQLLVGGESPVGGKRYVMKKGDDAVYALDSIEAGALLKSAFELRDKSVADDFDRDEITAVVVMTENRETICNRNPDEEPEETGEPDPGAGAATGTATNTAVTETEKEEKPEWSFSRRPDTDCSAEAKALMSWLDFAKAEGFEDDYISLKDFGLDNPRYKLILWKKDNTSIDIEVGGKTGGEVFIRNENRNKVYRVKKEITEKLNALQMAESRL